MADNTEESTKPLFQTIPVETRLQIYGDTCHDTRIYNSDQKQNRDHDLQAVSPRDRRPALQDRTFTLSVSNDDDPPLRPSLASFDFLESVQPVRMNLTVMGTRYTPIASVVESLDKLITRLRESQQLRDFKLDYSAASYAFAGTMKDSVERARNVAIESGTKAGSNKVQCELDFASRTLELLGGRVLDEWVQDEHIADDGETWSPDLDGMGDEKTTGSWGGLYW
ncbi:hypothetical protein LTR37_014028 [Vermiconidia calcicola]|uniref:Uncharacterized protein n=1 Tax=Vermiconidia calcicola TaxID=1690605 RepID=A0ACC3MUU9_9PEZI|nr:hypothetical protein LTR37_014028 [Vermiconidia calcicola]